MSLVKAAKKEKTYEWASTVLGVDASTNSFAFCLMDRNGPVRWGEIHFKGDNVFERLAYGQRHVAALKQYLGADLVVFESAIFVQNKKTVIQLAYAFGAVISALINNGAEILEVSPLQWQYYINNKPLTKEQKAKIQVDFPAKSKGWYDSKAREQRKQFTMDWAATKYGIVVTSDNVSDAVGVAHYAKETFLDPHPQV